MKNSKQKVEPSSVSKGIAKPNVMRCYYDDELCEGQIMQVGSFKKYLCEKCAKEDDSVCDEPLDNGRHAMDYMKDWD